jgi:hypothetical protein
MTSGQRRSALLVAFLLITLLIGLTIAQRLSPPATERDRGPIHSSYHPGLTGALALFEWLAESGFAVRRWREEYTTLLEETGPALLILIGPLPNEKSPRGREEILALQHWLRQGGRLLQINAHPASVFDGVTLHAVTPPATFESDPVPAVGGIGLPPTQPTRITKGLTRIVLSPLATRIVLSPPQAGLHTTRPTGLDEEETVALLQAPIIHFEDETGALLVDFQYGKGRVVFLTDPFVVSNEGLGEGDNLRLTRQLVEELTSPSLPILFDESPHGYRVERNPILAYFRGTPLLWLLLHGLLSGMILLYSVGRRFARPLPLRLSNRHSPLESLASLAQLRQTANARDLAIESIYPRFRQALCQRVGCSPQLPLRELLPLLPAPPFPATLPQLLLEVEKVLNGQPLDDQRLLELITQLRHTALDLGLSIRTRRNLGSPSSSSKRSVDHPADSPHQRETERFRSQSR